MKKLLVLVLALLAAAAPSAVHARPGALDSSFGRGGKVVRPAALPAAREKAASQVAPLPDGGAIVLSHFNLLAFEPDGAPGLEFAGGIVEVGGPDREHPIDIAVDSSGRVVVVGTVSVAGDPRRSFSSDESVFIARYTPQGQLDQTFGTGGILVTDLGFRPPPIDGAMGVPPVASFPLTRGAGVAVDADGRIVLSGIGVSRIAQCRGNAYYSHPNGFVARLLEDGRPDPSFAEGGVAIVPGVLRMLPPFPSRTEDVYLWERPDNVCTPTSDRLTRLTPAGQLDQGFGEGGSQPIPGAEAPLYVETPPSPLAIDSRGRIVLLLRSDESPSPPIAEVRRLLPNGEADRSFGGTGQVTVEPRRGGFLASTVLVDRRNRILLAGASTPDRELRPSRSLLLTRLRSRGEFDPSFGRGGWARTGFGKRSSIERVSATLSRRGVLLAANLSNPSLPSGGVGLARYLTR